MVRADQLFPLGIDATEAEKILHENFCRLNADVPADLGERWIEKLLSANIETNYFNVRIFEERVRRHWFHFCKQEYKKRGNKAYKDAFYKAYRLRFDLLDHWVALKTLIANFVR